MSGKRITKKSLETARTRAIATKAAKRVVNRAIESKHSDANAGYTPSTTASLVHLSAWALGDGDYNQRHGDKVRVMSMEGSVDVTYNATAGNNGVRVIVFRWRDDNLVTPVAGDILAFTANPLTSGYNWDTAKSRQILFDKTIVVDAGNGRKRSTFRVPKSKIERDLTFYAASGTQGSGHIYMMYVSDSAVNLPSLSYGSRITYKDA